MLIRSLSTLFALENNRFLVGRYQLRLPFAEVRLTRVNPVNLRYTYSGGRDFAISDAHDLRIGNATESHFTRLTAPRG